MKEETIELIEIKRIRRDYYENLNINKLDNLEEMDVSRNIQPTKTASGNRKLVLFFGCTVWLL